MLRSPTRPLAPRVKVSSTSPFDTLFLLSGTKCLPRLAARTRRDARSFIPLYASSVQPMTIVLDPPCRGQARRYRRENRHEARGAPRSTPSISQQASSIQERTVFDSLSKPSTGRSAEKIFLGFPGIPRKKSDKKKFLSVSWRDSTYWFFPDDPIPGQGAGLEDKALLKEIVEPAGSADPAGWPVSPRRYFY